MSAWENHKRQYRDIWVRTGIFFVLGLVGVLVNAQMRHAAIEEERSRTARQAVSLASQSVNEHLLQQRHLLRLFTQEHRHTLQAALDKPDSVQAIQALEKAVQQYFPEAEAYTLANAEGQVLLNDFDGLVGEGCSANIRNFSRTSEQHLKLHPNPVKIHYDVMTPFGKQVFFVTFAPRRLSRILAEHEQPGMQLFILERDGPLVELSGQGHRLELKRPEHLSLDEQGRILAVQDVPAAQWRVVALPISTHGPSPSRTVRQESAGLLAGLGLFAFGFHHLLGRERKRRHAAEEHAREMAELGFVDALTGLPNRRALDADLEREWLNLERADEPLSLLMIDLDHFKAFNDTYGHLAGDHCLRLVGQAMRTSLKRPRDRIARFGGEEFAILLPNTPCLAAKLLADALHETVREAFQADLEGYGVTLSIGITCAHAGKLEKAADLLDLADQALYGAKGAGRDTTVVIPAS